MATVSDWFSTRLAPPPEQASSALPDWASDLAPWQVAIDAAVAKFRREHVLHLAEREEHISEVRQRLRDQEQRINAQESKIDTLLALQDEDRFQQRFSDLQDKIELQEAKLRNQEAEVREAAISRELVVHELDLRTQARIEQVVLERQAADKSMCDWLAERQEECNERFSCLERLLQQAQRCDPCICQDVDSPRKSKGHCNGDDAARSPLKEIVNDLSNHFAAMKENSENIVLTTPRGELMSIQEFIECLATPRGDRVPCKELITTGVRQHGSLTESAGGFRHLDEKMLEMKVSLQKRLEELDARNRQDLASQIAVTREYVLERLDSTVSAYHGSGRQRGRMWRMIRHGRAQQVGPQKQRRIKAD